MPFRLFSRLPSHGSAFCAFGLLFCLVASVPVAYGASPVDVPEGARPTDGRIFVEGRLIRVPRPAGASGDWVVLDDTGSLQRRGSFRQGEQALYMGDLGRGVYCLFWGVADGQAPSAVTGPSNRASFMVVPDRKPPAEDHYVAVNQGGLLEPLSEGAEPDLSATQRFVPDAMSRLGIRRLRMSFARDRVRRGKEAWDFRLVDEFLRYGATRGVRFIAVLGRTHGGRSGEGGEAFESIERLERAANSDVDYARALLRRFGFKFDVFALWPHPNTLSFPGAAHLFVLRNEPVYRVLRERSPYSSISLGGLASEINDPTAISRGDFVKDLFAKGVGLFDVLDVDAEGTLDEARKFAGQVDGMVRGFIPNERPLQLKEGAKRDAILDQRQQVFKPRGVSRGGVSVGGDSIVDQRRQAAQMVQKLAWFRHHRYHYFALAGLVDPGAPGASGVDTRDRRLGGVGLFTSEGFYPRVSALAVHEAVWRLAGSRVVEALRYASETVEVYGFEHADRTVVVGWAPTVPGDGRTEKRMVVEFFWPDAIEGRVYDMLGRDVTSKRLRNVDEAARIKRLFLADVEPAWLVIPTPANTIRW